MAIAGLSILLSKLADRWLNLTDDPNAPKSDFMETNILQQEFFDSMVAELDDLARQIRDSRREVKFYELDFTTMKLSTSTDHEPIGEYMPCDKVLASATAAV